LKTWQYDRTGTLRVSPPTRGRGLKRHLDPNRGLDPDREQTEMALKEFVSEIKLLFAEAQSFPLTSVRLRATAVQA
jgi:hypothetical protein